MIRTNRDGLTYFQFPHMAACQDIEHGIFSRKGGVSQRPYDSLNVGLNTGDKKEHVNRNRQFISHSFDRKKLVFAKQLHGTDTYVLSAPDIAAIENDAEQVFYCDALITGVRKLMLVIQVADCQPVLLYDARKNVIANVHSGWRGSIGNIIGKTIQEMKERFGCRGQDLMAGIGPSLGPCCAEFVNYRDEIPEIFWKYKDESDHFDFWSLSIDQLCSAGVLPEKIYSSSVCTKCNADHFYSYRQERVTGRFAAVIGLVEQAANN